MAKKVSPSKFFEWKGLDRISIVIHEELRCIFREISKDDFGIDGELEVVVPTADGTGFETRGGLIKVQAKSGSSYVKGDSPAAFHTPVERDDLLTWNSSTYPVIFVVYHPDDDCLYWKDVKAYIKATPTALMPPVRIEFDKATDRFDAHAYEALCALTQSSPPRVAFAQSERLYTNLLPVKKLPGGITFAPTDYRERAAVRKRLEGSIPPYVLADGCLYTLADLRDSYCNLRAVCDTSKIRDLVAKEWIHNAARRKDYVSLLNQLLRKHAGRCEVRYNPEFKRFYFPRTDETSLEFNRTWNNARTGRKGVERQVAKYYEYGVDRFWRHLAANLRFMYLEPSWFLEIVPKYFFTEDGEHPYDSDKAGPYTTKKKALEHNIAVLNHVLFWSDILAQGSDVIEMKLGQRLLLQVDKQPLAGVAPFAIPSDPAIYEETDSAPLQLSLFEQLFPTPWEDDSDDNYL